MGYVRIWHFLMSLESAPMTQSPPVSALRLSVFLRFFGSMRRSLRSFKSGFETYSRFTSPSLPPTFPPASLPIWSARFSWLPIRSRSKAHDFIDKSKNWTVTLIRDKLTLSWSLL